MDRRLAVAYGIAGLAVAIAFVAVMVSRDTRHPALDAPPPAVVAAAPAPTAEVVYVDAHGRPLQDPAVGDDDGDHDDDDDGGDDDDDDDRDHPRGFDG
jgi:hypothetical protein